MQTASVNQNRFEVPEIKPLNGINDYPTWHRKMRCWLRHRDLLVLGLQPEPNGNSPPARTAWERDNFSAKSSITLAITEPMQVRAMVYTDDDQKSAHNVWHFLESTFTKSN